MIIKLFSVVYVDINISRILIMLRTNFQITAAVDQIAKIAMDNALIANAQDVRSDGNKPRISTEKWQSNDVSILRM